jgi:hypothetical protein
VESEKYDTLTVNELLTKLKLAEVDRGMTAKIEGPTDSHSLALVGGSKGKANTNPSTKLFSLSSLMSMPDEEFDVLGEDELALLTRRFKRLHENRVDMRTCFKCGKDGHYFAECPKVNNHDKHKFKDKTKKSKKKNHRHGKKTRFREKMKRSSDIESDYEDTSSSSSDEDEEDDKKKKKKKKNVTPQVFNYRH